MHHAPPLRRPALEKIAAEQKRATEEQLGVANRNDDFATKFYHQAHCFVNAYGFAQMDGFHCQGTENGQCLVAQPSLSFSD